MGPPWQGLNTRGILNFRAKGIIYFGPLKTKWKFLYICLQEAVNEFLLLVLYECTSQLSKNMLLKLSVLLKF